MNNVVAKAPVTPGLRPGSDLPATEKLESWANRRKNVRLVTEVVGDRQGKISRSKVDGHVQNFYPAIPNRLVSRLIVRSVVGLND